MLTNIWSPYRDSFFRVLRDQGQSRGIDVVVLFMSNSEPGRPWRFPTDSTSEWYEVLDGRHWQIRGIPIHWNRNIAPKLRDLEPDWVICGGSWFSPTVLRTAAIRHKEFWSLFWSENHRDATLHPTGPIAHARQQFLNSFDGFVVPNERSATHVRDQISHERPIIQVPNTVDEGRFSAHLHQRSRARQLLGIREGRTLLLVARLLPRKRVVETVEAFLQVPPSIRQQGNLVVAGGGPLKDSLSALTINEPSVHLVGELDLEQMTLAYHASDGFVLLSSYDPNPLSCIEAAFSGLPLILSSEVGNCQELIPDGTNGAIIDARDPTSRVEAIADFFKTDSDQLLSMGATSNRLANENFLRSTTAFNFLTQLLVHFPIREGKSADGIG